VRGPGRVVGWGHSDVIARDVQVFTRTR
jgi:hypothetical protein